MFTVPAKELILPVALNSRKNGAARVTHIAIEFDVPFAGLFIFHIICRECEVTRAVKYITKHPESMVYDVQVASANALHRGTEPNCSWQMVLCFKSLVYFYCMCAHIYVRPHKHKWQTSAAFSYELLPTSKRLSSFFYGIYKLARINFFLSRINFTVYLTVIKPCIMFRCNMCKTGYSLLFRNGIIKYFQLHNGSAPNASTILS